MNAYDDNVQTGFLDNLKVKKTPATFYMKNGAQVRGAVARYDKRVIVVSDFGNEKMIYHGAISTIAPHYPPRPHYVDAAWGGGTP